MSWQKERDKWLTGKIPEQVSWHDVENWLRSDPVWNRADEVRWKSTSGSHGVIVKIQLMAHFGWKSDILDINNSDGGKKVKKWQVEKLVKGYKQLETLDG